LQKKKKKKKATTLWPYENDLPQNEINLWTVKKYFEVFPPSLFPSPDQYPSPSDKIPQSLCHLPLSAHVMKGLRHQY
jgi:hypothetical protein